MSKNDNIFFDLADLAELGPGAIVGKTVRIRKPRDTRIGAHSIIDDFTYISCRLTVGRYTHISANAVINGGNARVALGDFVNLAPGCRLIAGSNDFSGGGLVGAAIPSEWADEAVVGDIELADHVLLGTGTVVLPGVRIPEGVATGAMTLITPKTKLEPWTLYVGAPARPLRKRDSTRILARAREVLGG